MLTDFLNSFTVGLSGKLATKSYLNISPYLSYVAMKYLRLKNRHHQEVIEANGHVRLSQ